MLAINGFPVGPIGFGLMGFTWRYQQIPDEQAFEAMDYAVEHGATFWNSGEFYGLDPPTANLDLLARYFEKRPENANKVVLSVKGGMDETMSPRGDEESVCKSVRNVLTHLRGTKKLDLFECARVDPNVPIEDTMKTLKKFVDAGEIGSVGLSEASAETIRRAHAVLPIAAVEAEYSMWSREIEENGVLSTCKSLNIPIAAYSPLARGLLTGAVKTKDDLEKIVSSLPFYEHFDRFQPEIFEKNLACVEALEAQAKSYNQTLSEMALSFLITVGEGNIIPIPGATNAQRIEQNLKAASKPLSATQVKEIYATLDKLPIVGHRYNQHFEPTLSV
ncbi:pyridoxal reductase Plr1 [Schizosaccharomyces cryophilus OY26]|uniref:Pyridoxal reductase Plr1 n=1 Tax=Schizosaccharomyces cryophilus (strain OY26 / ATCC MYA-4695 / CBS 11777 / NBRC 106824 / NRRL Y48691) TaxID=653667 RepID=S9X264_SCHCR|nr:pyridoxal reductase Plr1 [Schizosaccharomyces cryophilus OY26]EPY51202.1 pyridoxal reductase Plr1 [Schizosaccharomyces cryophilus OY26]